MSEWTAVSFFSARQIAELMEIEEDELPAEDVTPIAYYGDLRARSETIQAIDFLAHALPRYECVAWAGRLLDDQSRTRTLPVRDRLALDTALRWLGEPVESNRLATYEASESAHPRSAERMLALAVYFSGGTLSTPDLPPVNPPPEVCARFAAGAVKASAFRTEAPAPILSAALKLGEAIAERGVAALSPA